MKLKDKINQIDNRLDVIEWALTKQGWQFIKSAKPAEEARDKSLDTKINLPNGKSITMGHWSEGKTREECIKHADEVKNSLCNSFWQLHDEYEKNKEAIRELFDEVLMQIDVIGNYLDKVYHSPIADMVKMYEKKLNELLGE